MAKADLSKFSIGRSSGANNKDLKDLLALGETKLVPLELVKRDENQPRPLSEVMEGINEFADELERDNFVLAQYPVFHIEDDGSHTIVVGERRTAAFKLKGRDKIPAICRKFTKEERDLIFILQYVENDGVLKKALSPMADAKWWRTYTDTYHAGVIKDAALARGRTQADISNRLAILEAPENIKQFVEAGNVKDPATIAGLVRVSKRIGETAVDQVMQDYKAGNIKGSFRGYIESISRDSKTINSSQTNTESSGSQNQEYLRSDIKTNSPGSDNPKSKPKPKDKATKTISPITDAVSLLERAQFIDDIISAEGEGDATRYDDLIRLLDEAVGKIKALKDARIAAKTILASKK